MNDCMYCESGNQKRMSLMTFVCELPSSVVYLFRDQTYPGRTIVASKRHFKEIFEMSEIERDSFFSDVARVAESLTRIFNAEKINYAIWGDKVNHTHIHLVPKTHLLPEWGNPFLHDPDNPIQVSEQIFQFRIEAMREALE